MRGSTIQDPVVDKIIAHAERVAEHGVPEAARAAAKIFIADTLAVGIAGCQKPWRLEILDMLAGIGGAQKAIVEGRTVAAAVTSVLGSPERPMSPEAARAKFTNCWQSVRDFPSEQATALWDALFALETLADLRSLAPLGAPRRAS